MVLPNMGYKPPHRAWFLRVRILKSGIIFDHLVSYMRGHRGFLLEVQSHAEMFSPWAANPT